MNEARMIELVQVIERDLAELRAELTVKPVARRIVKAARKPLNVLDRFISSHCFTVPGAMIQFADFFEHFRFWLKENEINDVWTKHRVIRALPPSIPYGIRHSNQRYLGNLSWELTLAERP